MGGEGGEVLGTLIPEEWVTRVGSQLSGMGPIEREISSPIWETANLLTHR